MLGMINLGMPENTERKEFSPDDTMESEFIYYAGRLDATADQIESAYFHLCKNDDSEITDPVVVNLYQEMDRLTRMDYPISRFAEMIAWRRKIEKEESER